MESDGIRPSCVQYGKRDRICLRFFRQIKRRLRCSRPFDLLLFEHTLRILDQQDRQPGDGAQGYGRETQQTVVQYLAEALLKIRRPFAEVFKEEVHQPHQPGAPVDQAQRAQSVGFALFAGVPSHGGRYGSHQG